ncbi:MAG: response regulator transcription factor [Ferruginibacter sp.]|nr:response regulator transcription factor [Chitinophagaceae bacterium]
MVKTGHLLVVDDDPDITLMMKTMLEFKGFTVAVADQAGKAVEMLRGATIDIVIMDMFLSGISGVTICAGFKKDPATSHIPVIMMSAHPDARKVCMDAGADDFVSKPFDIQDLLAKINGLIAGTATRPGSIN